MKILDNIESNVLDIVSATIPWAAPVIPAYIAYENMTTVLDFPIWLSSVGAVVIESLGLATIHTALQFWNHNQSKTKTQHESPVWVPAVLGGFYLLLVLTVNVMLDDVPIVQRVAKTLLSLMSVVGGITIALRSQYKSQLVQYKEKKQERKQARKNPKLTSNLPKLTDGEKEVVEVVTDWRRLSIVQKRQVSRMTTSEIVQVFGVSSRTALNWKNNADRIKKHAQSVGNGAA